MGLRRSRIAVMASGRGSNFRALATAAQADELGGAQIVGLICNQRKALALQVADEFGIPKFLIESRKFRKEGLLNRRGLDTAIVEALKQLNPDWICLAGYMLLLGPELVKTYSHRIINIHPSLLPKFKGLDAQKQALEAQESESGCTVHLVTEGLDDGPIILQSRVPIQSEDTVETLSARILSVEHSTYIEAVRRLCTENFEIRDNRVLFTGQRHV